MSALKVSQIQVGQSAVNLNNFVLKVPNVPDGSLILSRGVLNAPVSDVISIASTGSVTTSGALITGGSISTTGTITATGDVFAFSDARLKTDVSIITDALNKVTQLNGVMFTRLDGSKSTGVIAQDVYKVLPEAVTSNEEGMMSVAYGNLVGLLIEAIKAQQHQINELSAKIDKVTE